MSQHYQYLGEAEQVVPFTFDGPRVITTGDVITVADDDESFVDHPLFVRVAAPPPPTPDPATVPDPVTPPVQDPPAEPTPEPDVPVVDEPTA